MIAEGAGLSPRLRWGLGIGDARHGADFWLGGSEGARQDGNLAAFDNEPVAGATRFVSCKVVESKKIGRAHV